MSFEPRRRIIRVLSALLLTSSIAASATQPDLDFVPPACVVPPFNDVPISNPFCPYISQLANDGVTTGCGVGVYCPNNNVTRQQMAIFLERAMRGTATFYLAESLFGAFGGNGSNGARTVAGTEQLGGQRFQYTQLTIPVGAQLSVDQKFAFIAVAGRCTLAGTLSATGAGAGGGSSASGSPGGFSGAGQPDSPVAVAGCVAGAGGTGGLLGGQGGGASAGFDFRSAAAGGAAAFGAGDTTTNGLSQLLMCTGGGGGGGGASGLGIGGTGGKGGGVVYLECGELDFTGIVTAKGGPGEPGDSLNGAGGGGGGGVVLIRTRRLVANTGTVQIQGGQDGGGTNPGTAGQAGWWDLVVVP